MIESANLDGSGRRTLFDTDLVNPRAIIVVSSSGYDSLFVHIHLTKPPTSEALAWFICKHVQTNRRPHTLSAIKCNILKQNELSLYPEWFHISRARRWFPAHYRDHEVRHS